MTDKTPNNGLTASVIALIIAAVILLQAIATTETKVVHVHGHTCIETRGLVRSISCDWQQR